MMSFVSCCSSCCDYEENSECVKDRSSKPPQANAALPGKSKGGDAKHSRSNKNRKEKGSVSSVEEASIGHAQSPPEEKIKAQSAVSGNDANSVLSDEKSEATQSKLDDGGDQKQQTTSKREDEDIDDTEIDRGQEEKLKQSLKSVVYNFIQKATTDGYDCAVYDPKEGKTFPATFTLDSAASEFRFSTIDESKIESLPVGAILWAEILAVYWDKEVPKALPNFTGNCKLLPETVLIKFKMEEFEQILLQFDNQKAAECFYLSTKILRLSDTISKS